MSMTCPCVAFGGEEPTEYEDEDLDEDRTVGEEPFTLASVNAALSAGD